MIGDRSATALQVVVHGLILLNVLAILQHIVDPSHQPKRPLKVEGLFILAIIKARIAAVAIRQGQCGGVVGQRTAKAQPGRSPNLIHDVAQVLARAWGAVASIDGKGRGGQRDGCELGTVHSGGRLVDTPRRPWNRMTKGFVARRVAPGVLGRPLVDVVVVVVIDIPRIPSGTLYPITDVSAI